MTERDSSCSARHCQKRWSGEVWARTVLGAPGLQFSATISLGGWRHAADGAPREGRGAAARHHSNQPRLAVILALTVLYSDAQRS